MKQKYYLLFFALVFGFSGLVYGQTGIGTNAPHGSAQLEVQSTDKGVLIPRMTESQKNVITNPATGLLVYQTDGANAGFYYYDGTQWVHLGAQGPQGAIGPAGPTSPAGPNFAEEGFSATASAMSIVLNLPMQGWTVGSPYFNTTTFNPVTGIFTVPQTGCYQISATINYNTDEGFFVAPGVKTAFVVRRLTPVTTDLISGYLPVVHGINVLAQVPINDLVDATCEK